MGFTFAEAVLFAGLTAKMEVQAVILSIAGLFFITGSLYLVVLRCHTMQGFHREVAKAMVFALMSQMVFILIAVFVGIFKIGGREFQIWFSVIMIICACVYLVFDLCCVIIPNVMDKDEYVLASLMIYTDIAQIFWHLLILFGEKKE